MNRFPLTWKSSDSAYMTPKFTSEHMSSSEVRSFLRWSSVNFLYSLAIPFTILFYGVKLISEMSVVSKA